MVHHLSLLSVDRDIPFSFSLPLRSSCIQYSPEATISNVFTHNVCLPNIVDERTSDGMGWMDGRSRSLGWFGRTGGVSEVKEGGREGGREWERGCTTIRQEFLRSAESIRKLERRGETGSLKTCSSHFFDACLTEVSHRLREIALGARKSRDHITCSSPFR